MAQPSLWELPTGLPEIPSGTSGGIRKTWKHLIWRSHHLMPWRTGPLQQNKTIIGCSNKEQKTTSHHPQVLYPNPSFVMYQASYIYIYYIILYYIMLYYIILYYIYISPSKPGAATLGYRLHKDLDLTTFTPSHQRYVV